MKEPAFHDADVADIHHVRGNADDRRVFGSQIVALGIDLPLPVRAVEGVVAVDRLQITVVGQLDLPVVLDLVEVLLARHAADACHLRDRNDSLPNALAVLSSA